MKLYNTDNGIVIEKENSFYHIAENNWEAFVNDDQLYSKLEKICASSTPGAAVAGNIIAPMGSQQELWACGVTYLRSKIGRQEESKAAGGSDFYAKVYDANRPEVFFKSTHHRVVGHKAKVNIRKDSTWDVPEPELTLVVTSTGKIVGYTVGNDMSSRSIEGENPLYLPQAKTYDACAALGPCIYVTDQPLQSSMIQLDIRRDGETVFNGTVSTDQMKRKPEELVTFVYRECSFPNGCLIMTGTGIVPGHDFTLRSGDEIHITIENIGTLVNTVR
jgi:2-dehydro-3-deoxy-D-arabinonate dehydratase